MRATQVDEGVAMTERPPRFYKGPTRSKSQRLKERRERRDPIDKPGHSKQYYKK
jgi:hypothetical protein